CAFVAWTPRFSLYMVLAICSRVRLPTFTRSHAPILKVLSALGGFGVGGGSISSRRNSRRHHPPGCGCGAEPWFLSLSLRLILIWGCGQPQTKACQYIFRTAHVFSCGPAVYWSKKPVHFSQVEPRRLISV